MQKLAVIGIFILACFTLFLFFYRVPDERIHAAETFYRLGESAGTVYERKDAFNEALKLLTDLEREYHPEFGTGRLYFDLGNAYYQLGVYPFAILNYLKAESLMPREEVVRRNLEAARQKIALKPPPTKNIFITPFSFLSLPEYLQLFFFMTFLGICFYSVWIWKPLSYCKVAAFLFFGISGLILLHLGLIRYLSPVEGVLVKAVELRRDAGVEFAKVGDQPIPAGTVITILGVSSNASSQSWVKVAVPGGEFGYILQDAVRQL